MSETLFSYGRHLRLCFTEENSPLGLGPEELFGLAMRQNEKRPFLFVSRVLGKHLPQDPALLLAAGALLAQVACDLRPTPLALAALQTGKTPHFLNLLQEIEAARHHLDKTEQSLFIGFAETATGLGRAVANAFSGEMRYVNTTRHPIAGPVPLRFDEAHSHAPNHLLYLDPADPFYKQCKRAVLIDDELTTGRTALRLIETLHGAFGIREFWILTLLDNSSATERVALQEKLGIDIRITSLLRGSISDVEAGTLPEKRPEDYRDLRGRPLSILYLNHPMESDRRPLDFAELQRQHLICERIASEIGHRPRALFLGAGEFIFCPALIAGHCQAAAFHSTTQSPVFPFPGSAIESGVHTRPMERYSGRGFLYNVPKGAYERAYLITEQDCMQEDGLQQLTAYLHRRGISEIEVISV